MELANNYITNFLQILINRGIKIHGAETMTDICKRLNIDFISEEDFNLSEENTQEILDGFMIEYSKLGPISKMSIIALAKQYEIMIPEQIGDMY